ncbi:hypothetical protein ESCO_000900 [Escovopsis weberi]|uniref:Centromere protein H C-terminal domain-containing protein n=1 Tax=Escovopsis weberi TaxID=150374 RepID=A0A0M9VT70_ESCWE|nr:hypothetical protein ESCO_000900 [Escovopsis weberi]
MSDAGDEPMADGHADEARLPLSHDELAVLELYDKLHELILEIAILNAQSSQRAKQPTPNASAGSGKEDDGEELAAAQNALLDARARYNLRKDAIEAVMMATPVLKAVHNSTQASAAEHDLLPLVQKRDETAIAVAASAAEVAALREDMTRAQVETIRVAGENTSLAAQLLALAARTAQEGAGRMDDPEAREELEALERDVRDSRRRWRVMKGVASGIIAGSGVDWAADDGLREIVLDPESDE